MSLSSSWAIKGLVKRVVELSSDLASQCAMSAATERSVTQQEKLLSSYSSQIVSVQLKAKEDEVLIGKLKNHVAVLNSQVIDAIYFSFGPTTRLKLIT